MSDMGMRATGVLKGFAGGLLVLALMGAVRSAAGQAIETAGRKSGLLVFGEYVSAGPDYGPERNMGGAAGVDLALLHRAFTPSLEARATYATGSTVKETTYGGGLRLEKQFNRFHPFANALVSAGTITFVHPITYPGGTYSMDNSIVFTYGGGVDVDLRRRISLRGDFQMQHWNLGGNSTLTPMLLGVGVVYRIGY